MPEQNGHRGHPQVPLTDLPLFRAPGGTADGRATEPGAARAPAPDLAPARGRAAAGAAGVDWALVRDLRRRATDLLARRTAVSGAVSPEDQRELGRDLIGRLVEEVVTDALRRGDAAMTRSAQGRLAVAVFDAMFGLGRLQPLVDDPRVENIEVFGDRVRIVRHGGETVAGEPIADGDDDLVEYLRFLADRAGRPFSPAHPSLHLQLPGGARLAATAWISPRPAVVVRKHRLVEVTLTDLERTGMIDARVRELLAAAIRARLSVVVSGPQGSGKTTLVRAMAREIDGEHVGTAETELELFLHELPHPTSRVTAWEARPGNGERTPDGRSAGEVTLDDIVYDSLRFNLSRLIVGEVRGSEVLAMFKAMQAGAGSLSTTHAHSARAAIDRLVTCAMEAGPRVTEQYAYRQVADHLRLVVQLQADRPPGRSHERFVSEVVAVDGVGESGRPTVTDVFAPGPDGRARPGVMPSSLARELTVHGWRDGVS